MAWLAVFPARLSEIELDLHGYRYLTAERVASTKIKEAYANGFVAMRIHHGRSTAGHDAFVPREGTLKAMVLALLATKSLATLLDREPYVSDSSTLLFFRPSARRRVPAVWTALPRTEFSPAGAPPRGAALPGERPLFAPPARPN